MTDEELIAIFDKYDYKFLKFDRVQNPKSIRPDLHAFILLDSLVPGDDDIVSCAEHDEIFLEVNPSDLAKVATEEQLIELMRCGVRYDSSGLGLAMFV